MIDRKQACAVHVGIAGAVLVASCVFALATPTPVQDCDPWDCGTNTPNLYNAAISVVSLEAPAPPIAGAPPAAGAPGMPSMPYVEQGSLVVDRRQCLNATRARYLGIDDGALVGMDARRQAVCTGARLTNARFKVRVGTRSFDVVVRTVGWVFTWERDSAKRRPVRTYRFASKEGQAICRVRAWMEDWQIANLGPSMQPPNSSAQRGPTAAGGVPIEWPDEPDGVPPISWATATDEAVLYQGETYARDATIALRGARWINIGCARSGVAKMRLMGFNPMATGAAGTPNRMSTEDQRVATAKMITARYKGTTSYTEQGMPLLWLQRNGINYYGDPPLDDAAIGPIESHWDAGGAQCLSHLRWARQPPHTAFEEATKRAQVAVGSCAASNASSMTAAYQNGNDKSIWTTFTYTHVAHPP